MEVILVDLKLPKTPLPDNTIVSEPTKLVIVVKSEEEAVSEES